MTNGVGDDYRALLDRIKTFGVVALSIVIDLFFVAIWAVLHQGFDILMQHLRIQGGLNAIAATTLEYVFTIFTLGIVIVYVVADFFSSARRIWKRGEVTANEEQASQ